MNKILLTFCNLFSDLFKPMTEQAKINSEFYISQLELEKEIDSCMESMDKLINAIEKKQKEC